MVAGDGGTALAASGWPVAAQQRRACLQGVDRKLRDARLRSLSDLAPFADGLLVLLGPAQLDSIRRLTLPSARVLRRRLAAAVAVACSHRVFPKFRLATVKLCPLGVCRRREAFVTLVYARSVGWSSATDKSSRWMRALVPPVSPGVGRSLASNFHSPVHPFATDSTPPPPPPKRGPYVGQPDLDSIQVLGWPANADPSCVVMVVGRALTDSAKSFN